MITVFSEHHRLHDTDHVLVDGLPYELEETPERAEILLQTVVDNQLGEVIQARDFGREPVLRVHDPAYLEFLEKIYPGNTAYRGVETPVFPETYAIRNPRHLPSNIVWQTGRYAYGVGTPVLTGTWEAAYWSAQCAITGAELLLKGGSAVYALCRPPGHHAMADQYGGFCYLNNAAIAARYLGGRGAILDIDYHHGNGTQEIFYRSPEVLFTSLHATPDEDYPFFWGGVDETGEGPGKGYNLNWPLPLDISQEQYLETLDRATAWIGDYSPQWLVVSLGFDTAEGDPVGGLRLTPGGFREAARCIDRLGVPTLLVQEGGYQIERLGEYAAAFLGVFAQRK